MSMPLQTLSVGDQVQAHVKIWERDGLDLPVAAANQMRPSLRLGSMDPVDVGTFVGT